MLIFCVPISASFVMASHGQAGAVTGWSMHRFAQLCHRGRLSGELHGKRRQKQGEERGRNGRSQLQPQRLQNQERGTNEIFTD